MPYYYCRPCAWYNVREYVQLYVQLSTHYVLTPRENSVPEDNRQNCVFGFTIYPFTLKCCTVPLDGSENYKITREETSSLSQRHNIH